MTLQTHPTNYLLKIMRSHQSTQLAGRIAGTSQPVTRASPYPSQSARPPIHVRLQQLEARVRLLFTHVGVHPDEDIILDQVRKQIALQSDLS
jgi:hypothetical protein